MRMRADVVALLKRAAEVHDGRFAMDGWAVIGALVRPHEREAMRAALDAGLVIGCVSGAYITRKGLEALETMEEATH